MTSGTEKTPASAASEPESSVLALAETHREIDDVRAGKELAEAQRLGEILVIHPPTLLDQRLMRPIDRAAEAREADLHESDVEVDEPVEALARRGDLPSITHRGVAHTRRPGTRHHSSITAGA